MNDVRIEKYNTIERGYKLTPFQIAIYSNDKESVDFYLNNIPEININQNTYDGKSLLELSLSNFNNDFSIVKKIIEYKGFDHNNSIRDMSISVIKRNNLPLFLFIKDNIVCEHNYNNYIFDVLLLLQEMKNIELSDLDLLKYLIKNYSPKDNKNHEMLLAHLIDIKNKDCIQSLPDSVAIKIKDIMDVLFSTLLDKSYKNDKSYLLSDKGHLLSKLIINREYTILTNMSSTEYKEIFSFSDNTDSIIATCINSNLVEQYKWFKNNILNGLDIKNEDKNKFNILSSSIIRQIENSAAYINRPTYYKNKMDFLYMVFEDLLQSKISSTSIKLDDIERILILKVDYKIKEKILKIIKENSRVDDLLFSSEKNVYTIIKDTYNRNNILKWLVDNKISVNNKNKKSSTVSLLISQNANISYIEQIIGLDNVELFYEINKKSVFHVLNKSHCGNEERDVLFNLLLEKGYNILDNDESNESCIDIFIDKSSYYYNKIHAFYRKKEMESLLILKSKNKTKRERI